MLQAEIPDSLALNPENLARHFGLTLDLTADMDWPLSQSHFVAVARGASSVEGFGSGPDKTTAEIRAIAEYVERVSLACSDPQIACTAPWQALTDEALFPPDLGLYGKTPEGLASFSPSEPLEWVEAQELIEGRRVLIPVEFFFPRVRLRRSRLVAETSNGAAAHGNASDA